LWNNNFFATTFNWTPSSGLSSSSIQNPKAKPTTNTSYTVTVNGTCPTTVDVTVNNPTSFSYTTNGMVASFSKNGNTCNTFVWDFGNGNTSSINPNPIVTYATAGTYGVCLQCNGQPSSCVQCINITVPSNTSGMVGIENIQKKQGITIYPNPSSDIITIEAEINNLNSNYIILNSIGQQVLSGELIDKKNTIEIRNLPEGFYLIRIGETEGYSFKFIKN
jgi:PKD repeat protein